MLYIVHAGWAGSEGTAYQIMGVYTTEEKANECAQEHNDIDVIVSPVNVDVAVDIFGELN